MTKEEIFSGLKETISIVKPRLNLDNVTFDSQLVNDLCIDSLSMMLMSLAIEQKFGIEFEIAAPFKTVGEVVDYVSSRLD